MGFSPCYSLYLENKYEFKKIHMGAKLVCDSEFNKSTALGNGMFRYLVQHYSRCVNKGV